MKKVFLVSCVSAKNSKSCVAKELYISDWFRKAKSYVEKSHSDWFILSALYGLVSPETIIDPYEKTLNKMGIQDRRRWASSVMNDLRPKLQGVDHIVMLAGERYREFLMEDLAKLCRTIEVPLRGLTIGKQLAWLKAQA